MTPADPGGEPGDDQGGAPGGDPHESSSPYLRHSQTGYLQSRKLMSCHDSGPKQEHIQAAW